MFSTTIFSCSESKLSILLCIYLCPILLAHHIIIYTLPSRDEAIIQNQLIKNLDNSSQVSYRLVDFCTFSPIESCIMWYSCSSKTEIPYLNFASLGLKMTVLPSFNRRDDLEPRKTKSNHSLAPEISPTIRISSPRYPRHIPIYSSCFAEFSGISAPFSMAWNTFLALSLNKISANL